MIPITYQQIWQAEAAQDALSICEEKGYQTYEDYKRMPFSNEAVAVRCRDGTNHLALETVSHGGD